MSHRTIASVPAVATLFLVSILHAAIPTGRLLSTDVSAANVDRVEVIAHGQKRGEIRMSASGVWQERTNPHDDREFAQRVFEYEEQSRNAEAVILWDAYRGIQLEINIASREVYYSDNNIKRRAIYNIGAATRAELVDGRKVKHIVYETGQGDGSVGSVSNDDGDLWVLREGETRAFLYINGRSESVVQLRDYTNQAFMYFNLATSVATIGLNDGRASDSRPIVSSANEAPPMPGRPAPRNDRPNGHSAQQLTLGGESGAYATLVRNASGMWTFQTIKGNNAPINYYETGRDDWSVYLAIDPAGTRPLYRLDLFEEQVYHQVSGRHMFIIESASNVALPAEQRVVRNTSHAPSERQPSIPPATPVSQGYHAELGTVTYGENGMRVGEYTNLGDGRWQDTNVYGGTLILIEDRRNDNAVYLKVPDRNESIQLNLTTRRINRLTSSSTAALYEILSTTALPPQPVVQQTPAPVQPSAPQVVETQTAAVATAPSPSPVYQPAAPVAQVAEAHVVIPATTLDTTDNPRLRAASTSPGDCGKEGQLPCSSAPAIFVQQAPSQGCPAGSSLFPLVQGGSCWSCPEGSRYLPPSNIEGPSGCTYPAGEDRAPARFTGNVELFRCPNGGAARGLGNKCYACPSGYLPDLLEDAEGPRGCVLTHAERYARATMTKTLSCPAGSSAELLDSGNCWRCPSGFQRSGSPPSWNDACTTNIWDATFASLGAGTCAAGLENFRGVCERRGSCGAVGQRPCEIGERMPSCDDNAREDFKTNSCVALQPGESPFIAGLGSVSEFYGDTIVTVCKQTLGSLRFDGSTDLGVGANCTKDIFTGAACQHLAASLGGKYAAMVSSAASIGPQVERFKRKVDAAYLSEPCNQLAETLRPAQHHGKASGLDCAANQFWDPNGSCYSCPEGFSRTMNPVTSEGACVDKPGNEVARSACSVYRAAVEDLEGAALCTREVLDSGIFLDQPMDLNGAQAEVCMATGEFVYSIYRLLTSPESPEKKSSAFREGISQLMHKAGIVGAGKKVLDKGDNLGTAFEQLAHCK